MSRRAPDALFMTDGEIAERVGLSAAEWVALAGVLERSGLPRRDPSFKGRRYWPAVRAYLDRRAGLGHNASPPAAEDGEEHWNDDHSRRRPRARA